MTSSLIASAMLRDPLYHIECLTAPSYTKYLISSSSPDEVSVRIRRTASQAMRAVPVPELHCGSGRSHHRHNARTGCPDGSAASTCRTRNEERGWPGVDSRPLLAAFLFPC